MVFVLGALFNPFSQSCDFLRSECRQLGLRRRHVFFGIFAQNAPQHFAFGRLLRDYCTGRYGDLANIEPQVGFALGTVRPVTEETLVRQNRSHVAVEFDAIVS